MEEEEICRDFLIVFDFDDISNANLLPRYFNKLSFMELSSYSGVDLRIFCVAFLT